jgi:hypothetical protein
VTEADPIREPRRHDSDVAAQAPARESVHVASPLKSSDRIIVASQRERPTAIGRPPLRQQKVRRIGAAASHSIRCAEN